MRVRPNNVRMMSTQRLVHVLQTFHCPRRCSSQGSPTRVVSGRQELADRLEEAHSMLSRISLHSTSPNLFQLGRLLLGQDCHDKDNVGLHMAKL